MKQIILLFIISLICYTSQAQSVPNGDFEYGKDTLSLNNWHTINELTGIIFPFIRTTDSYSGEYAVKLQTLKILNIPVPGLATLGEVSIGDVHGSIHFPYRPNKLIGMYKHPAAKDASLIWVYFLKKQGDKVDTIGQGTFFPDGNIQEYKAFEIDIEYNSASVPDSMNILLISDIDVLNSSFYIDNLEFLYTSNSVSQKAESNIEVYPNPANTFINIKTNGLNRRKYVLLNIFGDTLLSGSLDVNTLLDLSEQPVGVYFLVVENKYFKIIKK